MAKKAKNIPKRRYKANIVWKIRKLTEGGTLAQFTDMHSDNLFDELNGYPSSEDAARAIEDVLNKRTYGNNFSLCISDIVAVPFFSLEISGDE